MPGQDRVLTVNEVRDVFRLLTNTRDQALFEASILD
jgi:hypothetical protein